MSDEVWVRIASTDEVQPGNAVPIDIKGLSLALFLLDDGTWHITDNVCTHAFALLTDGWLEECYIECPLHAGRFDVRTGRGQGDPIEEDLKTYPIRIEGDAIYVGLAE